MKKIRAAIVGYGNIGKYVLEALEAAPDFEVAGVVRRNPNDIPDELKGYTVTDTITKLDKVDVAVLATPTRSVETYAKEILSLGINTVDSFDIHGGIVDLRRSLDAVAKAHNTVAVISAGWDPGSDSIVRALLQAIVPKGITYTNFGPGMSMGHTVAVKAIAEMYRQTGKVQVFENGMMKKGVLVRHLVLPGCRHDSMKVLDILKATVPVSDIRISLMRQYTPCGKALEIKNLSRKLTTFEYNSVTDYAAQLGFDGYTQDKESATFDYTPEWDFEGI